jgi:hypothetical protein
VASLIFGPRNRIRPLRAGEYLAVFAGVKLARQMEGREKNVRSHWKYQATDRIASAVFQRIEEFWRESGKYLDRLFGGFCPVWRIVKNGTASLV